MPWLRTISLLSAIGSLTVGVSAPAAQIALTFDDLPLLGAPSSIEDMSGTTTRLLDGLRRHHLRAIGFVIGNTIEGSQYAERVKLLRQWLDAGMDLGNHSYSHASLNKLPVDAYIADVARGDGAIRSLLAERGRTPVWYRHPFLATGTTLAAREKFESWLTEHDYRVAPVTMENSDWMFALPYDDAVLHGNAAEAARIRRAYVDFTAKMVPWYRSASVALLGREVPFVILLHASRLNADSIDDLALILKANHLHGVSLKHAMKDPAYRTPDNYAGPNGIEWLERWSLTLHKEMPWRSMPTPPADIAALSTRLDAQGVAKR